MTTPTEFDLEKKYEELRKVMAWEQGTDSDENIKESLKAYKEKGCPHGTEVIDWLMWNGELAVNEMLNRLRNKEDYETVMKDYHDPNKQKFYT